MSWDSPLPEPRLTRICLSSRGSAPEQGQHDPAQLGGRVAWQPGTPPGDERVGPHEEAAAVRDFADLRPRAEEVVEFLPQAEASRLDRHVKLGRDRSRSLVPGIAADAGQQGEAHVVDQVQRRDAFLVAPNPDVRKMRARNGTWLEVEFPIPRVFRKRLRQWDGAAAIPLPQLDAVSVELIVHEIDSGEEGLAPLLAAHGIAEEFGEVGAGVALGHPGPEAGGLGPRLDLNMALHGAIDYLAPDGLALLAVGVEEAVVRTARKHPGKLPSQVVRVLNGRVRAEAVGRRVTVCGIAREKNAADPISPRDDGIYLPRCDLLDLERDIGVADRFANVALQYLLVGRATRPAVAQEEWVPLRPRRDARPDAHPDIARLRGDESDRSGAVCRKLGEVDVEPDADRLANIKLALEIEADIAGDEAAAAIGADEVLAADVILVVAGAVANPRGYPRLILVQIDQLCVEADLGAMPARGFEDDRLGLVLRDVAQAAVACAFIVGFAIDAGSPCCRPRQFQAGKRGREDLRTHDVLWHRRLAQKSLDAQVAQDFDGSLICDVGTWRISRASVLGDADGFHARPRQESGCGKSRRAGADDEDIGFDQFHRS